MSAAFLSLRKFCLKKIGVSTAVSFNKLQDSRKMKTNLKKINNLRSKIRNLILVHNLAGYSGFGLPSLIERQGGSDLDCFYLIRELCNVVQSTQVPK